MAAILSQSHRWRSFRLDLDDELDDASLQTIAGRLPTLKRAAINADFYDIVGDLSAFGTAALLTDWEIRGSREGAEPGEPIIPSRQVNKISFTWTGAEVLNYLSGYPFLRELYMMLSLAPHEQDNLAPMILLPVLQSLTLELNEWYDDGYLNDALNNEFTRLKTPELLSLTVSNELAIHDPWCSPYFISRSDCSLTFLELRCLPMDTATLLSTLSILPSLQTSVLEESIKEINLQPAFFNRLGSPSDFVPRLQHLELLVQGKSLSDGIIAETVARQASHGLKTFDMHINDRPVDVEAYASWKWLHYPRFHVQVRDSQRTIACSCRYADLWNSIVTCLP